MKRSAAGAEILDERGRSGVGVAVAVAAGAAAGTADALVDLLVG
jgi:hypothetical protein